MQEKSLWLTRFCKARNIKLNSTSPTNNATHSTRKKPPNTLSSRILDVEEICKFAEANKNKISFALVGSEKPIIEGIRDQVEKRTGIPVICPKQQYAIEVSKVEQRVLFDEIAPEANPRFKVFDPADYKGSDVKADVYRWLDELDNQAVVKPDKPALGKGVGVWGDHFANREQLFEHFMSNFQYGSVIIEEKIDGEESSFMAFCDGKHFVPLA